MLPPISKFSKRQLTGFQHRGFIKSTWIKSLTRAWHREFLLDGNGRTRDEPTRQYNTDGKMREDVHDLGEVERSEGNF